MPICFYICNPGTGTDKTKTKSDTPSSQPRTALSKVAIMKQVNLQGLERIYASTEEVDVDQIDMCGNASGGGRGDASSACGEEKVIASANVMLASSPSAQTSHQDTANASSTDRDEGPRGDTSSASTSSTSSASVEDSDRVNVVEERLISDAFRIQGESEPTTNTTHTSTATTTKTTIDKKHDNDPLLSDRDEDVDETYQYQHAQKISDSDSSANQEKLNKEKSELIRTTSTTTTLHFKSGLSLLIPTRFESDKKVVQNANSATSRAAAAAPVTTASSAALSSTPVCEDENEVHQRVSFGALQAAPTASATATTSSFTTKKSSTMNESKRKNAQRITDAKQSAARAMMASSMSTPKSMPTMTNSNASSVRLFKNLRLAFPSSSKFNVENASAEGKSELVLPSSVEEESIVLTIDPTYLLDGEGMQFLNDMENIINTALRSSSTSSSEAKYKFLNDEFLIQDRKVVKTEDSRIPKWLNQVLRQNPESDEMDIPLVLVLLAQVENSILQSYRQQNGMEKASAPNGGHEAVVTESTLKNEEVSSVGGFILPQCLDSQPPSSSDHSFISSVFEAYKRLKVQNNLRKAVDLPSFPSLPSMVVQDFILTPLEHVMVNYDVKVDADSNTRSDGTPNGSNHHCIQGIVSKWNSIIDAAHEILEAGSNHESLDASDHEVVKLFQDEVLTTKKNKKKKKKKKKKVRLKMKFLRFRGFPVLISHTPPLPVQKRKGTNSKNGNNAQNVQQETCESDKAVELKDETTVIATNATVECSNSAVSTTSDVSESLEIKEKEASNVEKAKSKTPTIVEETTPQIDAPNPKSDEKVEENGNPSSSDEQQDRDNNDDGWETVEPKGGRNKKTSTIFKAGNDKSTMSQNAGRNKKGKSKSRNRNRQKDKEQAKANLDSHEIDIAKRGANTTKALMEERNKRQTAAATKKKVDIGNGLDTSLKQQQRAATLKDAVVGNLAPSRFKGEETLKTGSASNKYSPPALRVNTEKAESSQFKKPMVTDQNTASTVQETVSATSRSFAFGEDTGKRLEARALHRKFTNEVTTAAAETRENSSGSSSVDDARTPIRKSSAPPLQTLVGPGNFNSANSSVASSLEAPHATRHGSNKHHSSKEDDVGYHLLKVCERLSGDMNTFMARRALALSTRRRERGALLASLQETVQSIWAEQCRVEMYGSCATQLDLPSSDLDVVICGLDRPDLQKDRSQSFCDDISESGSHSASSLTSDYHANQFYPPLSTNGTRVLRLATELERVPWVVQVKAIPTASVPVIKILADPSRLPGAAGMDWMLHQQQMAAAAVAAAEMNLGKMMAPQQQSIENSDHSSHQSNDGFSGGHGGHINPHIAAMSGMPSNPPSYHAAHPPWRGADVMNGLLSLDITFEGPEHGGLGSTAFSAQLVQDACNETGLPPESTPAVQVLMIIKEMLAQRRLNEPFSGGLSSYAILLLVAAVVKERRIIRKEIELLEKQRQAVESSAVNDEVIGDARSGQESKKIVWPAEKHSSKKIASVSSWASIAMRSSTNNTQADSNDNNGGDDCSSKVTNETLPTTSRQSIPPGSKLVQAASKVAPPPDSTLFSQGSNDVLEVLCSGEPTAGKLLMHFLLFYGRHFDPNTTCIDVSGTHHPDYKTKKGSSMHSDPELSPFTVRKAGGTYNPVTDVYTVDPIIVYDPLEGSELNNVARSCYAWGNIQWAFGQCYNTLSGVVELGAGSNSDTTRCRSKTWPMQESLGLPVDGDTSRQVDDLSPLLELLLSF